MMTQSYSRLCSIILKVIFIAIASVNAGCAHEDYQSNIRDASRSFAITGATVIDGLGNPPLKDHTVVVRNGKITTISPDGLADLHDVTVIPANGRFLIPGLWDFHAHTFAEDAIFDLYMAYGVTGLRDMGCSADCARVLLDRRDQFRTRPGTGPRILFAGPMINGSTPYDYPSHYQITLDTLPEAIALLNDLNVDFIKVREFLSADEFYAVVSAAKKNGLPFAGHLPTAVNAADAANAGMLTVEHEGGLFGGILLSCSGQENELRSELLSYMYEAAQDGDVGTLYKRALGAGFLNRLIDSYDDSKCNRVARAFADNGTAWDPTLVVQDPRFRKADPVLNGRDLAADPFTALVPASTLSLWRRSAATEVLGESFAPADHAAMEKQYELIVTLIDKFHRAGVPILAGTDADFPSGTPWIWPGVSLHYEMELLVDAGLTPLEAIAASTGLATKAVGLEEVGAIAPGQAADMVLLTSDPLKDIRNTRKIDQVVIGGVFIDVEALKRRIESLEFK